MLTHLFYENKGYLEPLKVTFKINKSISMIVVKVRLFRVFKTNY